ncbi:MAG: hypothetical protein P8X82_09130 [Gemmatimonadales bacterium]|jgi:hypothetical protein
MPEEAVSQFLNRITQISAVQSGAKYGFALEYLEMNEEELLNVLDEFQSPNCGSGARRALHCTDVPDGDAISRATVLRRILGRVTLAS